MNVVIQQSRTIQQPMGCQTSFSHTLGSIPGDCQLLTQFSSHNNKLMNSLIPADVCVTFAVSDLKLLQVWLRFHHLYGMVTYN